MAYSCLFETPFFSVWVWTFFYLTKSQTWKVTLKSTCVKDMGSWPSSFFLQPLSLPATNCVSLALTFLNLTQSLITLIPPFTLHQIHEVIKTTTNLTSPAKSSEENVTLCLIWQDSLFLPFLSLYKSEWCTEKCIDFEGWLQKHHRRCAQSCPR